MSSGLWSAAKSVLQQCFVLSCAKLSSQPASQPAIEQQLPPPLPFFYKFLETRYGVRGAFRRQSTASEPSPFPIFLQVYRDCICLERCLSKSKLG